MKFRMFFFYTSVSSVLQNIYREISVACRLLLAFDPCQPAQKNRFESSE